RQRLGIERAMVPGESWVLIEARGKRTDRVETEGVDEVVGIAEQDKGRCPRRVPGRDHVQVLELHRVRQALGERRALPGDGIARVVETRRTVFKGAGDCRV